MTKANNSIATKLQVNILNNFEQKAKVLLVHVTIQLQKFVVNYSNMLMK